LNLGQSTVSQRISGCDIGVKFTTWSEWLSERAQPTSRPEKEQTDRGAQRNISAKCAYYVLAGGLTR
jgi:hypothetical protein